MRSVALLLVLSACSGTPAPTQTTQSGPPAPLVATPADASDVVVARVNGRPVYGSCVQAQAARGATKSDALQQCVDFELLAQHAVAFATDSEVILATRTALVSELVAREYEEKFNKPADFGTYWDRILDRNKRQVTHGEVRASAYIRIPLGKTATPAEDAAAKAVADELAAAFSKERGLMAQHLDELARSIIGTRAKYEFAVVPPYLNEGGLVDEYAKPLFAIKEVGRSYPTAVRTPWGYDVIVLTELIAAANPSQDEIVQKALPEVKRIYFPVWTTQIAQRLGITPKIYDENVQLLEDLP